MKAYLLNGIDDNQERFFARIDKGTAKMQLIYGDDTKTRKNETKQKEKADDLFINRKKEI